MFGPSHLSFQHWRRLSQLGLLIFSFFACSSSLFAQEVSVPSLQSPEASTSSTKKQKLHDWNAGSITRAQVLCPIAESPEVNAREYNGAFVTMQYFGYLRRDPEPSGRAAWLQVINRNSADYRTMIDGFVNSTEYRKRFGQP